MYIFGSQIFELHQPGSHCNKYTTPPFILTHLTWVPQSRLVFGHSARRLASGPPALAKPNPTVCSPACRWRLRLGLWTRSRVFFDRVRLTA